MKTHYLKMKVTDEVRNAIAYQLPALNDYDKWLSLHRKLATNLEERDWRNKTTAQFHKNNSSSGGGSVPTERTVSQGGNAMDLDAVSALDVSLARMIDKAVIDYRVQNNLCKRCARPGHWAIDCRNSINAGIPRAERDRNHRNNRGRGRGGGNGNGGRPAMGQTGYGNGAYVNAMGNGEAAAPTTPNIAAAPAAAPAPPAVEYGAGNAQPPR